MTEIKTRIRVVEYADGTKEYFPEYRLEKTIKMFLFKLYVLINFKKVTSKYQPIIIKTISCHDNHHKYSSECYASYICYICEYENVKCKSIEEANNIIKEFSEYKQREIKSQHNQEVKVKQKNTVVKTSYIQ